MGIYYGTRLYYGRIMRKKFYQEHIDGRKLPQGLELFVINTDRIILCYNMESVDDGVEDRRHVPDYFKKSILLDINHHLTDYTFRENQEIKESFENFIGQTPNYYIVCYESTTYGNQCQLLYNIKVDLNQ